MVPAENIGIPNTPIIPTPVVLRQCKNKIKKPVLIILSRFILRRAPLKLLGFIGFSRTGVAPLPGV